MQAPKKRLPRNERHESTHVAEDENQHLWAVSYSDFLMALLSFFILFFSVDSNQRSKLIMQIASEIKGDPSSTGLKDPGSVTGQGYGEAQYGRMPTSLKKALSEYEIQVDENQESLVINLPNDFYAPGQYKISENSKNKVDVILNLLLPYQKSIKLYFEGHADSTPLIHSKNNVIVDNFVLSSLRASSFLELARIKGFNEKHLFIQAASSNTRNSRSLSIRIETQAQEKESL